MRGHLEHAVGRRVDNRLAGTDVFFAQLLDDLGAGCGAVAQRAASDALLEFLQHLGRKSMREQGEGFCQMNANHFPMAGSGVFSRRCERALTKCRRGPIHRTNVRQALQIAQTKLSHIRQVQLSRAGDVAQCIAARVSISSGVRHLAGTHAIQHNPGDARERRGFH